MFKSILNLVTGRLSTRLGIGFGLVALAGIVATTSAFRTINQVGKNLRDLGGVTWDAADGIMNAQIAMEAQVIAAHNLLSGRDIAIEKQRIENLSNEYELELSRAVESGFFDTEVVEEVSETRAEFANALASLILAHAQRADAGNAYVLASKDTDKINEIVEGMGDGNVENLESNPDQTISWNSGLSKYWDAADGAMESRIGYLQQIYGTQLLLDSRVDDGEERILSDADAFQDDAIQMMVDSGLFDVVIKEEDLDGRYVGQGLLEVYKTLTNNFRSARDRYIVAGAAAANALNDFSHCTEKMLERMSVLESLADQAVDQNVNDAEMQMAWGKKVSIGIGIFGLLAGIAVSFLTVRSVTSSVNTISDQLKEIASGQGDLTARLPSKRTDELGDLSRWFNAFVEQLQTMIQKVVVSAQEISSVAHDIAAASEQVTSGATRTKEESASVAAASEQMTASIRSVSESTNSISSNMRSVVERLSGMTQTIRNIVGNADTSSRSVAEARKIVVESSERVSKLQDSAADIDRILEVIQDIAEQTNLLALNATIEAARAGEAGKGFAVVATEVKALAKQTSIASDDIRAKIQGIQQTTTSAVDSIAQIRDVVDQVSDIVNTISRAVEAQSESTDDINRFVSDTSDTVDFAAQAVRETSMTSTDITKSVSLVDEIARTTADGARRYHDVGGKLTRMSSELQQLVGQFKA
jgi:methyl-accepting chemotaxis protein